MDKIVSASGVDLTSSVEFQTKARAESVVPDKPGATHLSGDVTVRPERTPRQA